MSRKENRKNVIHELVNLCSRENVEEAASFREKHNVSPNELTGVKLDFFSAFSTMNLLPEDLFDLLLGFLPNKTNMLLVFYKNLRSVSVLNANDRQRILQKACREDRVDVVEYLLEKDLTLEEVRVENNYFLRKACEYGQLRMVHMLFKKGMTLKDLLSENNSALIGACVNGHVEMVRFLFGEGLTLDDVRAEGNNALASACALGRIEIVRLLFEKGLTRRDLCSGNNYALRCACATGRFEIMHFLFEKGLVPDGGTFKKYALRAVILREDIKMARLLFKKGLNAKDAQEVGISRQKFEKFEKLLQL